MIVYMFMPVMGLAAPDGNHVMGALAGLNGIDTPNYIFLVLEALVALMALVTIFKFKNLKRQSSLCKITLTLTIALIITIVATWLMQKGQAIATLTPWFALPFVTIFFLMMAGGGINKDRKLLAEADRLR